MNLEPSRQSSESRSEQKRRDIQEAATTIFLEHGYMGSSMDDIAALAGVSKQTIYNHFHDKESLFGEVIRETAAPAKAFEDSSKIPLKDPENVEAGLIELGRWWVRFFMNPRVRQLRRLVIGESGRFPELGKSWYEDGFQLGIAAMAKSIQELDARGKLSVDDPTLAAGHFAGIIMWVPVNRLMFCGDDEVLPPDEVDYHVENGVRAFLKIYGRPC